MGTQGEDGQTCRGQKLRREPAPRHLDLGLVASRTVGKHISAVEATRSGARRDGSPGKLTRESVFKIDLAPFRLRRKDSPRGQAAGGLRWLRPPWPGPLGDDDNSAQSSQAWRNQRRQRLEQRAARCD